MKYLLGILLAFFVSSQAYAVLLDCNNINERIGSAAVMADYWLKEQMKAEEDNFNKARYANATKNLDEIVEKYYKIAIIYSAVCKD